MAVSLSLSSTRSLRGAVVPQGSRLRSLRAAPVSARRAAMVVRAGDDEEVGEIVKTGPAFKAEKEILEIKSLLPHRYPFLLVDRVVEFEYGKYAVGYKNITSNDQFFNGHFPERPIMPGVLQVEAMAQLGGIVMLDPDAPAGEFFFGGVDGVKWRRPVVPGDTLMMRVVVTKFNKRFGICKMRGEAYVGEELACEADMTLVLAKDA